MAKKQQKTKTLIEQHKTHRKTLVILGAPRSSAYFFSFSCDKDKEHLNLSLNHERDSRFGALICRTAQLNVLDQHYSYVSRYEK